MKIRRRWEKTGNLEMCDPRSKDRMEREELKGWEIKWARSELDMK